MSIQSVPRKHPRVALILSFLICGLGQVYARRYWRGLGLFILWVVFWSVFTSTGGNGAGATASFLLVIGLWLFAMVDAYQLAKRSASDTPQQFERHLVPIVMARDRFWGQRGNRIGASASGPDDISGPLRKAAATGSIDSVIHILQERLPPWPTSALVMQASRELLQLLASITAAQRAGVPKEWIRQFSQEANNTLTVLWRAANRYAAVKNEHVTYEALAAKLANDEQWLKAVSTAAVQARTGLAELTLWGERVGERPNSDLQTAQVGLQALANASRDL